MMHDETPPQRKADEERNPPGRHSPWADGLVPLPHRRQDCPAVAAAPPPLSLSLVATCPGIWTRNGARRSSCEDMDAVSPTPEPGLRHAALTSFAAGFVDAHGYFRLGHVFTANMTGNSVLLAVALADRDWSKAIDYVETIAAFIVGALAAAIVKRLVGRGFVVLLLVAAILVVLCIVDPGVRLSLVALAFAMGLQGGSLARFRGQRVQT